MTCASCSPPDILMLIVVIRPCANRSYNCGYRMNTCNFMWAALLVQIAMRLTVSMPRIRSRMKSARMAIHFSLSVLAFSNAFNAAVTAVTYRVICPVEQSQLPGECASVPSSSFQPSYTITHPATSQPLALFTSNAKKEKQCCDICSPSSHSSLQCFFGSHFLTLGPNQVEEARQDVNHERNREECEGNLNIHLRQPYHVKGFCMIKWSVKSRIPVSRHCHCILPKFSSPSRAEAFSKAEPTAVISLHAFHWPHRPNHTTKYYLLFARYCSLSGVGGWGLFHVTGRSMVCRIMAESRPNQP
eukprot:SAG31_NODE_765_length_12248_cov_6.802947_15_plen_301_part_00